VMEGRRVFALASPVRRRRHVHEHLHLRPSPAGAVEPTMDQPGHGWSISRPAYAYGARREGEMRWISRCPRRCRRDSR
jgi:hypothetical protein